MQSTPVTTYSTPRLPWFEPSIGDAEASAAAEVVRSGWVNEGPQARALETRVASIVGSRHVHVCPSGTSALFLALSAVGVGPGDEVIVPDLTFVATASAVRLCGAHPVLVDVEPTTLCLDPARVGAALTARTAAILPVHLDGRPADMEALRRIASTYERPIPIVIDACQALGSRVDGRALGTGGDVGCFSLAPTKIVTAGQGGLLVTDDDTLSARVIELKDHGRLSRSWNHHPEPGFNFKLGDAAAAVALTQLRDLESRLVTARTQWRTYHDTLVDVPGLRFWATATERGITPLWPDLWAENRPALIEELRAEGVGARPFWPPLHGQGPDHCSGHFPHAEDAAANGLWLPGGPARSLSEISWAAETTRRVALKLEGGKWL